MIIMLIAIAVCAFGTGMMTAAFLHNRHDWHLRYLLLLLLGGTVSAVAAAYMRAEIEKNKAVIQELKKIEGALGKR